jgi:hypothetical protein
MIYIIHVRLPPMLSFLELHSVFDKRDSLRREIAYKREIFCAFGLVSQA